MGGKENVFLSLREGEKMFSSLIVNRKRHLNEKRDEKCQRADSIIHLPTTVAYNVYKASSFRYFFWRNMRQAFHIEISIHFISLLLRGMKNLWLPALARKSDTFGRGRRGRELRVRFDKLLDVC
jgi:hypothetical protein